MRHADYMKTGKVVLEPKEYFTKDEVIANQEEMDPKKIDDLKEQEFFRDEKVIHDD